MSAIEFITYIEIPVRVFAEHQKAEHATLTYPGCPATTDIEDIEICTTEDRQAIDLEDLKDFILRENGERFKEESYDNI